MDKTINLVTYKDKSVYKKNMKLLKSRYPEYYDIINNASDNHKYQIYLTGYKKELNIKNMITGTFLYDIEDTVMSAPQRMDIENIVNARIAVFLGMGFGYEIDYFGQKMAKNNHTNQLIIVEKDPYLFKLIFHYRDFSPMFQNNRIHLILGETVNDFGLKLKALFGYKALWAFDIKCIKPIFNSEILNWDGQYYLDVVKKIKEIVVFIVNYYGNSPYDSLVGLENILENIDIIIKNPGVKLLYDKFKDIPAVVISTGPSLNKNKHLLKEIEDKALFICPDGSLRILMDMGIKPHFVTSLERFDPTAKLVEGFSEEEVSDVYFAAAPIIARKTYDVYPGPKVIVYRNYDHFRWLDIDRGILDIKQSSGNMAYKVADAMGCNPIILIGQDLAYNSEGISHAKGATYGEVQLTDTPGLYKIESLGNDGNMVVTNNFWELFRQGYEFDIANSEGLCINATEGGAFIQGTKVMTFKEAIDQYLTKQVSILPIIRASLSRFTHDNVVNDKEKLVNTIDLTKKHLDEIMTYCKEGFELVLAQKESIEEQIETKDFSDDLSELLRKVISSKIKVERVQPTYQLYLLHLVQSYVISIEMDVNALENDYSGQEVVARKIMLYFRWLAVIHDITKLAYDVLIKSEEKVSLIE